MTKTQTEDHAAAQTVLTPLLFGKQLSYALSGVARLGVPDHMSATPQPVEEIAAKVSAHAPSLYRVMRLLASMGKEMDRNEIKHKHWREMRSDYPGSVHCTSPSTYQGGS
jgi:hypothetical protein